MFCVVVGCSWKEVKRQSQKNNRKKQKTQLETEKDHQVRNVAIKERKMLTKGCFKNQKILVTTRRVKWVTGNEKHFLRAPAGVTRR